MRGKVKVILEVPEGMKVGKYSLYEIAKAVSGELDLESMADVKVEVVGVKGAVPAGAGSAD